MKRLEDTLVKHIKYIIDFLKNNSHRMKLATLGESEIETYHNITNEFA
jgi:hypothetical protein